MTGYDYTQAGWYFITLCTKNREEVFGVVRDNTMIENRVGIIVRQCWDDLPNHYRCELDEFIIMPNHIHGIIVISEAPVGAGLKPAPTGLKTGTNHGLSEIVRALKTFSSRRINEIQKTPGHALWQRGYFDHIIRDDRGLENIRTYIHHNAQKWELDRNNPRNRAERKNNI